MHTVANILRICHGLEIHAFSFSSDQKAFVQRQWFQENGKHLFLDCTGGTDASLDSLFREADTVVVNFPQERSVIYAYFQEHHRIMSNIFYLISNDRQQVLDDGVLCERVLRLPKEAYGVIPYNVRYEWQYERKLGYAYQKDLLSGPLSVEEQDFLEQTNDVAVKLLKMNGQDVKKESGFFGFR